MGLDAEEEFAEAGEQGLRLEGGVGVGEVWEEQRGYQVDVLVVEFFYCD